MSRILVIGATGGVGRRLCQRLVAGGHEVHGLHRAADQRPDLEQGGVVPVAGDLMELDPGGLANALQGCDGVVFTAGAAGSGIERTTAIDGDGVVKLIDACRIAGVSRVWLVSVFMDAGRQRERSERFEHYILTKRAADVALAASGLDWVILRPGRLHDEPGNGRIRAGCAVPYGTTARDHVAAMLAGLVDAPGIRHCIIEMTDGETPVEEVIDDLRSAR